MKTKFFHLLAIGLALGLAATGCKTKGPPPVTRFGSSGPGSSSSEIPGGEKLPGGDQLQTTQFGGGELANFNPDDMNQDRQALAAQTLYFDYDSSAIRPNEESKLDAVAAALNSDISAKLLVEGNCDERGTEEYNRSLGERRALAVREALVTRGVSADRIATRSYGEDRPAETGHDAEAWAKNRRDEFVLLHPR